MTVQIASASESVAFNKAPEHLFAIPELSFRDEVSARALEGPWFRIGAWTHGYGHESNGVEIATERLSILVPAGAFRNGFQQLGSIGNCIGRMGRPGGSVVQFGGRKEYRYEPFHCFEITMGGIVGEPLVFVLEASEDQRLAINPDILLFLGLQEKPAGAGIWRNPESSSEVIIHRMTDENLEVIQIRADYLKRYLKARQMSLLVGHYTHRHLIEPSDTSVASFVEEEVTLGSPEERAKAIFQNWGLRTDTGSKFLQRRLHLWFEVEAPAIDLDHPWAEESPFDPYQFTFPTRDGLVAPARWASFKFALQDERSFSGETCDFMQRVFFRQEVLSKYETTEGFRVSDDGAVLCQHYWGLNRSTSRLGNELVSTGIGDFAEAVPLSEWQHWAHYAVEPPSYETIEMLRKERTVCDGINQLVDELRMLNNAFFSLASSMSAHVTENLWQGSLDSLAGRQLKWVYPSGANDDEFIKRTTLTSTLVLEALNPEALRTVLKAIGDNLHLNEEKPPRSLGSRNLLQRLFLIAALISTVGPPLAEIPVLLRQAEQKSKDTSQPDLQQELEQIYREVRSEFSALAFLYDLRVVGGIAHAPNSKRIAQIASQLGLPERNWQRGDFIRLVDLVSASIQKVASRFFSAATILRSGYQ